MNVKKSYYLVIIILLLSSISRTSQTAAIKINETAPSITGSEIREFEISDDVETINWTVVDDNLKSYEITLNNVVVGFGEWELVVNASIQSITISYDLLLDEGIYIFTLTVTDYDDLMTTLSTSVNMKPPSSPDSIIGYSMSGYLAIFFISTVPIIIVRKKNK